MFENVVMSVQAVIFRQERLFISHLSFSCDTFAATLSCRVISVLVKSMLCHTVSVNLKMFEISKYFL